MQASLNVKGIPISTLDAVNIARFIRGKDLKKIKASLVMIRDMKAPLPHLKYRTSNAHKSGMMSGSYPVKAVGEIIKLLDSVEANARNRGMVSPFVITHVKADNGGLVWHHGRQRRQRKKNTNFEIIIKEQNKKQEAKKPEAKHEQAEKKEQKPEVKKQKGVKKSKS